MLRAVSRRRLPAPPLVLQPVFCRVRQGTEPAARLLEMARFLQSRGLLTDGGALSLQAGLRGRGGVLSLTTQDVRASAHGLARDLWGEQDDSRWAATAEQYYERFDRGKPRRPTRLQRLLIAWSSDLGPQGLLKACATHPRLWDDLAQALAQQELHDADSALLSIALSVHQRQHWGPWLEHFEISSMVQEMLEMLPLLPFPTQSERLAWLEQRVAAPASGRLLACRREGTPVQMPEALRTLTIELVASAPGAVDPRWLGVLRGYRWPRDEVIRLRASLEPDDPVYRIVYGPRPGQPWLVELLEKLEL